MLTKINLVNIKGLNLDHFTRIAEGLNFNLSLTYNVFNRCLERVKGGMDK